MLAIKIVFDVCTPNGVILFTEDSLPNAQDTAEIIGVDVKYIKPRRIMERKDGKHWNYIHWWWKKFSYKWN